MHETDTVIRENEEKSQKMRDITELPQDLFLIILSYLPPRTCVRCRSVSRQWFAVFTSDEVSLLLLRWNFPRCREVRLAAAAAAAAAAVVDPAVPLSFDLPNNASVELACIARKPQPWSCTFAAVARRYHHLRRAQPHVVEKLPMARQTRNDKLSDFSFIGVATWNRFLRLDDKTANFHYPDPAWWYSQEDGVLVYPAEKSDSGSDSGYVYQLYDLSTGKHFHVPFDVRQKHIRRVRLAQGVLIFEWAEAHPYHKLNDREVVHRHFVTAFDIVRTPSWTWSVEFRSEWKLHFLGLPLNRSDRFFSAHTATHYAVYFWQPNRSLYQDDPIEQLAVWDISSPSPYRPSQDPNGDKRPLSSHAPPPPNGLWGGGLKVTLPSSSDSATKVIVSTDSSSSSSTTADAKLWNNKTSSALATATAGPQVIRRMTWPQLDFHGLRQRATPQLRNLALDDRNLYVVEEEHRWADGQHSSLSPPRVHLVRCTGIPIIPAPPATAEALARVQKLATSTGSPYNNNSTISAITDGPVLGPIWVDACGADGDVNMSFCRRVAAANQTASGAAPGSWPPPPVASLNVASLEHLRAQLHGRAASSSAGTGTSWPWVFATDSSIGKHPSGSTTDLTTGLTPQRWPGWAPCWRHEDFPYLTVAEMVDLAAGVRVTARHCFMLETLSVHVRPAIAVKGAAPPPAEEEDEDEVDDDDGATTSSSSPPLANRRRGNSNGDAKKLRGPGRCEEVQFPDEMWCELVGRGHIAGDERWIVGEDERGNITIVRF
ncbi:hypothetical protein B0T17DRAFT_527804 [Bombardia bombarda]|uniref:F-box domain-containing protein n=1 Tax=Bombardia bombarda TaxID=252184 RepID=A0AA40CA73_9PEZI|nr:hypothetical protein B0T17DRAFT_527804 [Bombardia bombarda]